MIASAVGLGWGLALTLAVEPPNPQAAPAEGVHAVGSTAIAPLPPPPPPIDPSTIRPGPWRGVGWVGVYGLVTGPIGGLTPARPTVVALGGGLEAGWRPRGWIGLGTAFNRQIHEARDEVQPDGSTVRRRGYFTGWDVAFVRLWLPVRGRVEPYVGLGGGLAFVSSSRDLGTRVGGTFNGTIGFDGWVGRNVTIGLAGVYRGNVVSDELGHAWQVALTFASHW